jgi:hypothetical protein
MFAAAGAAPIDGNGAFVIHADATVDPLALFGLHAAPHTADHFGVWRLGRAFWYALRCRRNRFQEAVDLGLQAGGGVRQLSVWYCLSAGLSWETKTELRNENPSASDFYKGDRREL